MTKKAFSRIRNMSEKYGDAIELFPPASFKTVLRAENRLTSRLDNQLKAFFAHSNGARIMDYAFMGCKNASMADMVENTLSLWAPAIPNIALNFQGFLKNSIGENFGLLENTKDSAGNYAVAFLQAISDADMLVIASSLNVFLDQFLDFVEDTLFEDPNALLIDQEAWALNLSSWLEFDSELLEMYRSGELEAYYGNSDQYRQIVAEALSSS
ncbi:MAG: hypothetical protein MJA82_16540 [Clostridia bacterium]|nr:hypothetical protein [Clostridia bacterium]